MEEIQRIATTKLARTQPRLAKQLEANELDLVTLIEVLAFGYDEDEVESAIDMNNFCLGYKKLLNDLQTLVSDSAEQLDDLPLQEAQQEVQKFIANISDQELVSRFIPKQKSNNHSTTKPKLIDELIDCSLHENPLRNFEDTRSELSQTTKIEYQTFVDQEEIFHHHKRHRPQFPSVFHRKQGPGCAEVTNDVLDFIFKFVVGAFEYLFEHQEKSGEPIQPMSIVLQYDELQRCLEENPQFVEDIYYLRERQKLEWIALQTRARSFTEFIKLAFGSREKDEKDRHLIHYVDVTKTRLEERTKSCLLYYDAKSFGLRRGRSLEGETVDFADEYQLMRDLLRDPSKIVVTVVRSIDGHGMQFYVQMCGTRRRCHSLVDLRDFFSSMQSLLGLAPKPFWREIDSSHDLKDELDDATFRWCQEFARRQVH